MLIVFIVPPGAGKVTQAEKLVQHFDIPHLSTGDILREAVSQGTELGNLVAPIMASGQLVSDELMVGVIRDRIGREDCETGFLLDGFPRTIVQVEALARMLEDVNRRLDAVLELHVPEDELTRRLLGRYNKMKNPRADDRPEAIPKRLEVYREQTEPLLAYYAENDLLVSVDGVGSTEQVFQRILDGVQRKAEIEK